MIPSLCRNIQLSIRTVFKRITTQRDCFLKFRLRPLFKLMFKNCVINNQHSCDKKYKDKSKVGDPRSRVTLRLLFQYLLHWGVGEGATPFLGLLYFTPDTYLIMLSVKQGGIKYDFLSHWYDSTRDRTPVSRKIGKKNRWLTDLLHSDFNSMSTHLEIFHVKNQVHFYIFCRCFFRGFFVHSYIRCK